MNDPVLLYIVPVVICLGTLAVFAIGILFIGDGTREKR